MNDEATSALHSIQRYIIAGHGHRCIVTFGIGGWAATTRIIGRGHWPGRGRRGFERQEGTARHRRHCRENCGYGTAIGSRPGIFWFASTRHRPWRTPPL